MDTSKRFQIGASVLWLGLMGGSALYRTLSNDTVGADGRQCILPPYINRSLNPPELKTVRSSENIFDAIGDDGLMHYCSHPKQVVEQRLHPVASLIGSIFPPVIFTPFIYWAVGAVYRRYQCQQPRNTKFIHSARKK